MTYSYRNAALAGGIALIFACGAATAGPSMATKVSPSKMTLDACKKRAEELMKKANFKIFKNLQYSIYGENGDYSIIVRCAPEQGLVLFGAAGPRMERATTYVDEIGDDF
jgi:hypothetical protein